jgi:hypothetical protein
MPLEASPYWKRKRKYRPDIKNHMIELCIQNSIILRDRDNPAVFNAISRIPPSGRILKVVYRRKGKALKIITCYWLD